MSDTVMSIIAIFLAGTLMFLFPLMSTANRSDDISQQAIQTETTQFVDDIRSTGKITQDDYDSFTQAISAAGQTGFDVEIEVQRLDTNSSKKTTQVASSKVGENQYYSEYTSQIEQTMNDNNGIYRLNAGDIVSVNVKNKGKTIAQSLKNFFYRVTGNNNYNIAASSSGIVNVNG